MSNDEKIIYAIEKHKARLLEVIHEIRTEIGEDFIEVEFTDRSDTHPQIEAIQNHLTMVYVVSFLVQQLTCSIEQGEEVDKILEGISSTGAEDGITYSAYGTEPKH